jgi:hypothetical protein
MFVIQSSNAYGYRVVNTRTLAWDNFGHDRIGALDHCDAQNRRAEQAAKFAAAE